MKGKKVVDFLLLRPAFSQRNLTTLLLVGMFMAVYTLAGGRVVLQVPNIEPSSSTFGNVSSINGESTESEQRKAREQERAAAVLGLKATEDEQARTNSINERGKLFDPAMDGEGADAKLNKDGLLGTDMRERQSEEAKLRKYEQHKRDSLAVIEERLNIRRLGNGK